MERRKFTREFKLEAVRLIKQRGVSQDLSVHQSQLRSWVKALADDRQHAFPGQGQMKPEQLEIAELKRKVIRLKAERDILKKAAAYFAKEIDVKFGFIAKHRGIWPAGWLCGRSVSRERCKERLFSVLMAQRRSDPPTLEWVQALNLIDVVFQDKTSVVNKWRELYDLLKSTSGTNKLDTSRPCSH